MTEPHSGDEQEWAKVNEEVHDRFENMRVFPPDRLMALDLDKWYDTDRHERYEQGKRTEIRVYVNKHGYADKWEWVD